MSTISPLNATSTVDGGTDDAMSTRVAVVPIHTVDALYTVAVVTLDEGLGWRIEWQNNRSLAKIFWQKYTKTGRGLWKSR